VAADIERAVAKRRRVVYNAVVLVGDHDDHPPSALVRFRRLKI
jgi:hypothetical protein